MKHINYELQQILAFIAVAELGSFKKAADSINLSQPALSRRVERLEELLGVALLKRTTREVKLTPAGKIFLYESKEAVEKLDIATTNLKGISNQFDGKLTIACVPSVIPNLLIDGISHFLKHYPRIKIRISDNSESEMIESVKSYRADFGVGFLSSPMEEFDFDPLLTDEFSAVVSNTHALAKSKTLKWSQLKDQRIMLVGQLSGNRQILNSILSNENLQQNIAIETNRLSSLLDMAQAGLGVALLPKFAVPIEKESSLVSIKLTNPVIKRKIGIISVHGALLTPTAKAFIEIMKSKKINLGSLT